ncbi:LemA family protein [Candidatus Saccharibacteria bacterium]|nr:LemA family protein [Candidatus Saccharibacteria bacterium]
MLIVYIILGVIVLGGLWLLMTYNGLVTSHTRVDEALSDITVQMKRRLDLIPNIVDTVKGFAKQEKTVLTEVTKARTAAMAAPAGDLAKQAEADNMLSGALKSLFAVSESYPDLKSNQNFLQLQQELVDTEDKIQASRRFYNGNVRDFNIKLKVFPTNMIAQSLGFKTYQFFEVAESEKAAVEKPVDVNFEDTKTDGK